MKKMMKKVGWAVAGLAAALLLGACGTGTVVRFDPDGIVVVPPAGPIVIPVK